MKIHIEDLKFQCIIGILEHERIQEQDVIINFECEYEFKNEYINYTQIVDLIKKKMIFSKFKLIEDAILSLKSEISKEFPLINSYTLKISKPSILADCTVSVSDTFSV
ncbi:dihydroneopterin aldolase [Sulfurimonas lithotrophica]|uniref:Dihydroneopterin aldolase n=1 Tax=Sulfurimonas lithotrophica TaxID=2590022 RepID=A0A5P8P063_9BACT|nr:dihydroneopterin aldolase [Sulfurimonas lithotrophica]QFR49098.1 dihydroneopterin aldolase [Sulfurimonas lithotrophica]